MEKSACPYLGLKDDPETYHLVPSAWNCCHHARVVEAVDEGHQALFCLNEQYNACPVFLQQTDTRLPVGLRSQLIVLPRRRNVRVFLAVGVSLLLLAVLYGMFLGAGNFLAGFSLPTPSPLPVNTMPPTELPVLATETPYVALPVLITPLPHATSTRRPTATRTNVPPTQNPVEVIIYEVQDGEYLELIAAKYKTTVEAILSVNYMVPTPLWVKWPLVVPVGAVNASRLPVFEVYTVKTPVSAKELASLENCNIDQFTYYNKVGPDDVLPKGRVVLIPHKSGPTKIPTTLPSGTIQVTSNPTKISQ